jgi:hypothetical protein
MESASRQKGFQDVHADFGTRKGDRLLDAPANGWELSRRF